MSTAAIITLSKVILALWYSKFNFAIIFGFFWNSLKVYVGGRSSESPIDSKRPYKTILFVSSLGGTMIWIAFRSSLSAALAVQVKNLPFNDMESLSKTNWK